MRYHYKPPDFYIPLYGEVYCCNHPVYNTCTLYLIGDRGLSVIQQRFDYISKKAWWGPVDACIANDLYLHPKFKEYFDSRADEPNNGLYPTVSVRQIMWALKMKPIKRERWETLFDRRMV